MITEEEVDALETVAYARAIGTAETTTEKIIERPDGSQIIEHTTSHPAPDVSLIKFILVNRRPSEWREKVEASITGNITLAFEEQDEGVL